MFCRRSGKGLVFHRNVETSNGSYVAAGQGRGKLAQVIGTHAHVAVTDHHHLVLSFVDQTHELGDLIVGGDTARTAEHADGPFRKFAAQPSIIGITAWSSGSMHRRISYCG